MYTSTVSTLIKWFLWWYTGWRDVHEIGEFRLLGVINIIPHRKTVCNYITYDVPIKPHKTRRQSHTSFSIYTFENSASKQRSGKMNQHNHWFICSEFLYTIYLHIYHSVPTIITHPGMCFVPGGGWAWGSVTRDTASKVPTIAAASWIFRR
jgi:hypothetical protein